MRHVTQAYIGCNHGENNHANVSFGFRYQELLVEEGFQDGKAIDHDYFKKNISGKSNSEIVKTLFPTWSEEKSKTWADHKEAKFRESTGATPITYRNVYRLGVSINLLRLSITSINLI